jgi:NAD(P)-dependent dehydrogenase (short-subunit alcohol dehydrogenase family)
MSMAAFEDHTVLIAGATGKRGRLLAERLANTGAEQVIAEISKATGNDRLEWYGADFSDIDQVHAMADHIRGRHTQLHLVINNAGINPSSSAAPDSGREESKQGYELRFAVNYLAGFALIRDLYPLLNQTAKYSPTRVISVSDARQSPIDFDDVMLTKNYDSHHAYARSRLAQIMMTFDLAERCKDTNVAAVALHPSPDDNNIAATLRVVNAVSSAAVNGKYFELYEEAMAHPQAYDRQAREQLRELSEELADE